MALTGYAIGGIVMIFVGIVLLIAGVVLLAIDQSNQTVSQWWVWALIVIGIIALLVGIALFFIPKPKTGTETYMSKTNPSMVDPCNPCPQPCPPPPKYVNLQPCPQPCPPNPCNLPMLDLVHKDPCKRAAYNARFGLPPPSGIPGRYNYPPLMPPTNLNPSPPVTQTNPNLYQECASVLRKAGYDVQRPLKRAASQGVRPRPRPRPRPLTQTQSQRVARVGEASRRVRPSRPLTQSQRVARRVAR